MESFYVCKFMSSYLSFIALNYLSPFDMAVFVKFILLSICQSMKLGFTFLVSSIDCSDCVKYELPLLSTLQNSLEKILYIVYINGLKLNCFHIVELFLLIIIIIIQQYWYRLACSAKWICCYQSRTCLLKRTNMKLCTNFKHLQGSSSRKS